ncbi:hypothetical protein ILUMI_21160 [Ignelater luminosus]|uniref:Very long-chain specific acyl-CoA dehydrogenase, mitochondrial n=1 Tax=Ignelater luminosus TaxID=2038154 RepID=A0A8K0G3Z5_IGNLU|nr:hypothetical protein ILUMI_21160 [Ignelater luminosus]
MSLWISLFLKCVKKPWVVSKYFSTATESNPKKQIEEEPSFALNIFRGAIVEKRIFPFPGLLTHPRKKVLATLIGPLDKVLKEMNDPFKNEAEGAIQEAVLSDLKGIGFFGTLIPKEYGGLGLNNLQYTRLLQELGAYDLSLGVTLRSHQVIGVQGIMLFGNDLQQKKYLPRIAKGELAAFCLTESTAGSDFSSIKTKAVLSPDKSHYILNGSKIWINNGNLAEIFTVFANVPSKNLKSGEPATNLTAFIVEKSFGGITTEEPSSKMGLKSTNTATVHFKDVKVPTENVLDDVGAGIEVAMGIINQGRYGVAALLSGTMSICISQAVEYTKSRIQFKKRIRSFELIQKKLARMAMLQYVSESMGYVISANMDRTADDLSIEGAIAKVFSTEAAWSVCDECIQILGGRGYMTKTGLEKALRDVRVFRIFEVTNDVLRMVIALSGVQFAGITIKELQSVGMGHIPKRIAKKIGLGGSPTFQPYVHPNLTEPAKLASKCILDFGNKVEKLLNKYDSGIVNRQMILSIMADCAIDIYSMAVVLSRASSAIAQNLPSVEYETLIAHAWCVDASERVAMRLNNLKSSNILDNFKKYVRISEIMGDTKGISQLNPLNF